MSHLFSSLKRGALELENRIIITPMCQYSAVDGSAEEWHPICPGNLAFSRLKSILKAEACRTIDEL